MCSACERSGRSGQCSSANDQFAKGRERSYVASLEARVEKLEQQIAQAKNRKLSLAIVDPLPSQPSQPFETHFASGGKKAQRKEASDVDDLVSDFGFL